MYVIASAQWDHLDNINLIFTAMWCVGNYKKKENNKQKTYT